MSFRQSPPRRVRYRVAASLDGFIAGPGGEADWVTTDPDVDFAALFAEFDTLLVGRRTFEVMAKARRATVPGLSTVVFSRTLPPGDDPRVAIVSENGLETVAGLRRAPGKDIWLFGGGVLFRSLLAAGLVDTVEVAVVPALLGAGIPLLPPPAERASLTLTDHRVGKTGVVFLEYAIDKPAV